MEENRKRQGRRLIYDDSTNIFRFESHEDYLTRLCESRHDRIEAINRAENKKLDRNLKKFRGELHIFEMRHQNERDEASSTLRELIAYRTVLNQHERKTGARTLTEPNGSPLDTTNIKAQIESAKKKLNPTYRRESRARHLLRRQKPMQVMDRSLPTEELMRTWSKRPQGSVLPPTISRQQKGFTVADFRSIDERDILTLPSIKTPEASSEPGPFMKDRVLTLPSIYVTQKTSVHQKNI